MIDDLLLEMESRMEKAISAFRGDLMTIRTGRASPALVEKIQVEVYGGAAIPLNQTATIAAPEPNLLTIRPWDANTLPAIEKAILKSDIGLTPTNDGRIIRLAIPRLTEERRKELVKLVSKRTEEARVVIRNARRDSLQDLKAFEKEKLITEDDLHQTRDKIQEITDRFIARVDDISDLKEREILDV